MPEIKYLELGPHKRLHEIVMAGSHDAAITQGKSNIQTQSLNIRQQAAAGVRFFDLRIAAAATGDMDGHHKVAELRAFHADGATKKDETKFRSVDGKHVPVVRTKMKKVIGGGFGETLTKILTDARDFVENEGAGEFLLLKFDKSKNWHLIADACVAVLGANPSVLLTGYVNLNKTKLTDLRSKVVVLFSDDGANEVRTATAFSQAYGPTDGILRWRKLGGDGGAYQKDFWGLQYYGAGGTQALAFWRTKGGKVKENVGKQGDLVRGTLAMKNRVPGSEHVLGMMYWTTTGLTHSIETRNDNMWLAPNVVKMKQLWKEGLEDYVENVNPLALPQGSPAVGPTRKRHMPNIIMVDFADQLKCSTIYELNAMTPQEAALL
jgi:hypothetical protein